MRQPAAGLPGSLQPPVLIALLAGSPMKTDPKPTDHPKPAVPQGEPADDPSAEEREGATEREVGDRTGPGAGYDNEPEQDKDRGGVS